MRVLLDTNVLLDVMLNREPFSAPAARVLAMLEEGLIVGIVCATTVTTVYYLAGKFVGRVQARGLINDLLGIVEVAPVSRATIEGALEFEDGDFEDDVIAVSAHNANVDVIVTRDAKGFSRHGITVMSPIELLSVLADSE